MSLRRKVTGALAWAGLVIVIAVPAAELISSKLLPADDGAKAVTVSTPAAVPDEAVDTAPTAAAPEAEPVAAPKAVAETPAAPAAIGTDSALDSYLASGKKLPSYITSGKSTAAPAPQPAAATDAPAVTAPVVPAAEPEATIAAPVAPKAAPPVPPAAQPEAIATAPVVEPPPPIPRPATERPKRPVAAAVPEDSVVVTEDDLAGWKSGTLEDYLKQQGLLSRNPTAAN